MLFLLAIASARSASWKRAIEKYPTVMVLLLSSSCTGCAQAKKLIRTLKPVMPPGIKILSTDLISFQRQLNRKPNKRVPNYAIFRKGKLISVEAANYTYQTFLETIYNIANPRIETISNTSVIDDPQFENTVIFSGSEIDEQFIETAIHFRDSKIKFMFHTGEFGVSIHQQAMNKTTFWRGYPESIVEWIEKVIGFTKPIPFHLGNSSIFFAVTRGATDPEIETYFDYLSNDNIPDGVVLANGNWERDKSLLADCQISPNERSFVLVKPDGRCYPFVDDDVVSCELLKIFISRVMYNWYDQTAPVTPADKKFGMVSPLKGDNIAKMIPNARGCTMLHLYNDASQSTDEMQLLFARIARRFAQRNFKFYEFEIRRNCRPSWIPDSDGFSMFAAWPPGDRRPVIYRSHMTTEAVTKWTHSIARELCNVTIA